VFLAIGINMNGEKEVLGLWLQVVTELKNAVYDDPRVAVAAGRFDEVVAVAEA
jgi:transposase-like protein